MPKARAATKSDNFRIKKGRGGHRAGSLAKCWNKNAELHRDSQLEKHDELEGLQGPIRPFDVDENKKKIVPLDRKFLRSYAKNFATDAPPSDLLQMREGIARAKDMRLPSYFAVPICISKLGPSIDDMVEQLGSDDRPYRRDSEAMAKFIVDCAAEVRCRHEHRYACKDQETLAWTKHYSAAYGLLGPCACGEPGSDKRAAYLESMRALAKDIALHGLLSKLQDGQICPAEIAQIRERLGRIWSSPYVGQWVIRSVLWCSASAEDAVRLMGCYATSSAQVLCTKAANKHISFAEARALFPTPSPFLVAMHLCFAEGMQNELTKNGRIKTPAAAATWLAKRRVQAQLAAIRDAERDATGLEPRPDKIAAIWNKL